MDTERLCPKCGLTKDASLFQKNKRRSGGLSFWCKSCSSSITKEWSKTRSIEPQRHINKVCQGCGISKLGTEFPACCRNHDGLFGYCKECKSRSDKNSHQKHREKRLTSLKNYHQNHREQILAHNKEQRNNPEFIAQEKVRNKNYREQHKEESKRYKENYYQEHKETINQRFVERRHNDLNFRLKNNLRARLWNAVRHTRKKSHMVDYLGCSIEELRVYLEKLFKPDMTWDNYGSGWHIDHIKPCCDFDLTKEEEIGTCFHYTNLQPLWAEENMSKNRYGQAQCSRLHEVLDAGSNPDQP